MYDVYQTKGSSHMLMSKVNERCSGDSMPNAEVAKFRKSLLIEHTGKVRF